MATIYGDSKRHSLRLLRASSINVSKNSQNSTTSNSMICWEIAHVLDWSLGLRNDTTQFQGLLSIKLRNDPDLNVVEVDLSGIPNYKCSDILTNIHEALPVERINEKLFIKFDGMLKATIHIQIMISLEPQLSSWAVSLNMICVNPLPMRLQRIFPIIHLCPPSLLWIAKCVIGQIFSITNAELAILKQSQQDIENDIEQGQVNTEFPIIQDRLSAQTTAYRTIITTSWLSSLGRVAGDDPQEEEKEDEDGACSIMAEEMLDLVGMEDVLVKEVIVDEIMKWFGTEPSQSKACRMGPLYRVSCPPHTPAWLTILLTSPLNSSARMSQPSAQCSVPATGSCEMLSQERQSCSSSRIEKFFPLLFLAGLVESARESRNPHSYI
ncbi:hypothetical protein BC937DRAFT_92732 [Endogone sp. FLAS-F59071]|nr:hypothetical protein BC937DRAFT_92732 [Endogone sp. FLAS-F59071]|eukprot:RUS15218.1 hypothetical protein BC937DRAFT_92732 [Endogone sp. FLAS-F59071]